MKFTQICQKVGRKATGLAGKVSELSRIDATDFLDSRIAEGNGNPALSFSTEREVRCMECPGCKTQNPERNRFCRECGARLLSACPQCGTEGPPEDKFCGECGKKLAGKGATRRRTPGGMVVPMDKQLTRRHPLRVRLVRRETAMAKAPVDGSCRAISICNQKGGVGKTVTPINLSAGLAASGLRTLLVDIDPQGLSGIGLGAVEDAVLRRSTVQGGEAERLPHPIHALTGCLKDEERRKIPRGRTVVTWQSGDV